MLLPLVCRELGDVLTVVVFVVVDFGGELYAESNPLIWILPLLSVLLLFCCVDDAELPELMFSLFIVILLTVEIGGTFVQINGELQQQTNEWKNP